MCWHAIIDGVIARARANVLAGLDLEYGATPLLTAHRLSNADRCRCPQVPAFDGESRVLVYLQRVGAWVPRDSVPPDSVEPISYLSCGKWTIGR